MALARAAVALTQFHFAAEVDQTKTGQAGNFKMIDFFNAEKTQRRKIFVVESARRIIRAF